VARPPARDDEQGVDANIVPFAHIPRGQPLSGRDYASQAILVERERGRFLGRSGLHFNEGKRAAAPGDDIDFTPRDPRSPRQNAPAVKP
jgi:hypothetical protein